MLPCLGPLSSFTPLTSMQILKRQVHCLALCPLLSCHQYADDTQLYLALPPDSKRALETLNRCLEEGLGSTRVKQLKLNPKKTGSVGGM